MPKSKKIIRSPVKTRSKRHPIKDFTPYDKMRFTSKWVSQKLKYINLPQCLKINDIYYHVDLDSNKNERLNSILPILKNPNELEDGIYMYVILSYEDQLTPALYAIKVLTSYELGTKHLQLTNRIVCENDSCKKFKLYYAGELKKENENLFYNFYSGSFKMEKKITKKEMPIAIMYMDNLLNLITNNKYKVEFVNKPLLTKETLLLTFADLDKLKEVGAIIHGFTSRDKCIDYYYFTKTKYKMDALTNPSHHNYESVKLEKEKLIKDSILYSIQDNNSNKQLSTIMETSFGGKKRKIKKTRKNKNN